MHVCKNVHDEAICVQASICIYIFFYLLSVKFNWKMCFKKKEFIYIPVKHEFYVNLMVRNLLLQSSISHAFR